MARMTGPGAGPVPFPRARDTSGSARRRTAQGAAVRAPRRGSTRSAPGWPIPRSSRPPRPAPRARLAAARKAETAATELLTLRRRRADRDSATVGGAPAAPRGGARAGGRDSCRRSQVSAAAERVERLEQQVAEGNAAAPKLEEVRRRSRAAARASRRGRRARPRRSESWRLQQGARSRSRKRSRASSASVDERIARHARCSAAAGDRRARGSKSLRASLDGGHGGGRGDRATAWVRDAQDAQTKRQGLLDQYQELKDQRQRIVDAGPDGDLSHLRPPARRRIRRGARAARCARSSRWWPTATSTSSASSSSRPSPRSSTSSIDGALALEKELSEATAELGRLNAQAQETQSAAG